MEFYRRQETSLRDMEIEPNRRGIRVADFIKALKSSNEPALAIQSRLAKKTAAASIKQASLKGPRRPKTKETPALSPLNPLDTVRLIPLQEQIEWPLCLVLAGHIWINDLISSKMQIN